MNSLKMLRQELNKLIEGRCCFHNSITKLPNALSIYVTKLCILSAKMQKAGNFSSPILIGLEYDSCTQRTIYRMHFYLFMCVSITPPPHTALHLEARNFMYNTWDMM